MVSDVWGEGSPPPLSSTAMGGGVHCFQPPAWMNGLRGESSPSLREICEYLKVSRNDLCYVHVYILRKLMKVLTVFSNRGNMKGVFNCPKSWGKGCAYFIPQCFALIPSPCFDGPMQEIWAMRYGTWTTHSCQSPYTPYPSSRLNL